MTDQITHQTEEQIRKSYLGKTCLTLAIWMGVVGFAVASWLLEWNLGTKGVILNIAAYSSVISGPLLMYSEWRGMRKELHKLEKQ